MSLNQIHIIGDNSPPDKCEYCGKIDELRPYGKNGAKICFECGMLPENIKQTEEMFDAAITGKIILPTKEQTN